MNAVAGSYLAGERTALTGGGLRADVLHDVDALAALASALQRLVEDAADPNPFHEPWLLLPALRRFAPARLHCLVLRDASGTVHGLLPLVLRRSARSGLLARLETWRHPHAYDATPLVSSGRVDDCVRALLDWLASPTAPSPVLELPGLCGDTRFARSLQAALAGDAAWWHGSDAYERAMYVAGSDAVQRYPARRRKELRRQWRKLAGRGSLVCRAIAPGDDAEAWARRFLALEASGWKGRHGTALASTGAGDFFVRVVDDGPGLSDERKRAAFHRYGHPEPRGHGLGLAIVQRLAVANGGDAALSDTPGGGLTVELDLGAAA